MITNYVFYYPEAGNVIIRKADNFLMGDGLCMGVKDSIDNYFEREGTKEEFESFLCDEYSPEFNLEVYIAEKTAFIDGLLNDEESGYVRL